jgi:hypothetical protein
LSAPQSSAKGAFSDRGVIHCRVRERGLIRLLEGKPWQQGGSITPLFSFETPGEKNTGIRGNSISSLLFYNPWERKRERERERVHTHPPTHASLTPSQPFQREEIACPNLIALGKLKYLLFT